MKSIFDKTTRDELIERINSLNDNSKAQWGKMNVYQMLKHCTLWEEMISGKRTAKRMFAGRIFGKVALKAVLKNDKPFRKNSPTGREFIITEKTGDVALQKNEWINCIAGYEYFNNPGFVHPFFGIMAKEQIGRLVYKHADHHLRQFGA